MGSRTYEEAHKLARHLEAEALEVSGADDVGTDIRDTPGQVKVTIFIPWENKLP